MKAKGNDSATPVASEYGFVGSELKKETDYMQQQLSSIKHEIYSLKQKLCDDKPT